MVESCLKNLVNSLAASPAPDVDRVAIIGLLAAFRYSLVGIQRDISGSLGVEGRVSFAAALFRVPRVC